MSTSWEFAHNLAMASTGMRQAHEPEVRIEHIEMGVFASASTGSLLLLQRRI